MKLAPGSATAGLAIVPISSLRPAMALRAAGVDAQHVRLLAEAAADLPPILVHRPTMRVIDGMHRVNAALLAGREQIEARFFDGPESAAFVLAVSANIAHGLPLTRADREAAAIRVIRAEPRWSDRAIAASVGLSADTVGALRRRATVDLGQLATRIGRDGRARPVDGAEGRRRAREFVLARPDASLREIARAAGISPATARDVRDRLQRGEDPVLPRRSSGANPVRAEEVLARLRLDPAVRFTEHGRAALRWLEARVLGPGDQTGLLTALPPHSARLVAGLARDCAQHWRRLAEDLDRLAAEH
ncbi:hypothetical protein [Crossiella sp. CA198]|uniref:hypothetical protein n=1 Tax=Crossiella sp. CA198 TaxID=3455607 RepID=UPI003F8D0230